MTASNSPLEAMKQSGPSKASFAWHAITAQHIIGEILEILCQYPIVDGLLEFPSS
jgi:hypothetical protein